MPISSAARLSNLRSSWLELLRVWAAEGTLNGAAQQALGLAAVPETLRQLSTRLAAGNAVDLPAVELLNGSAMAGALGAYAGSTATIYLNADWLDLAEDRVVLAVLTEEFGHHLDALLNPADTPGDEGALFAALLTGQVLTPGQLAALQSEDDRGVVLLNGAAVAVEQANLTGTAGGDVLTGTADADTILGLGGNDQLFGEAGNDSLIGAAGHDELWGGEGSDTLLAGEGDDALNSDSGNDLIDGGEGLD
ncbi:MAG: calcium-binding protein, partial [Synechococcaceae cyanobacterium]